MTAASPPATIAVMTAIVARRWLFFRWTSERWQSFERKDGLAEFRRRFVAFPAKMVVVAPEFSSFDARFRQTFAYVPLAMVTGTRRRRTPWSDDELAFFGRCLSRIDAHRGTPGGGAGVAWIDGNFLADDGRRWTAPFEVVEHKLEILSREACADRILPALAAGIGAEEGGVYAPYGGDGVFMLASM
jgi:hypothetical protein